MKLSERSLHTANIPDNILRKKHVNAAKMASLKLAEALYLKREQCVQQLKYSATKIKSFAESIVATIDLQNTEKERQLALLGLQCHNKASEAFFTEVSYKNGSGYDYEKQKEQLSKRLKNAAASNKQELYFECSENCILLDSKEVEQFSFFIHKTALMECSDIRKHISEYLQCSKYKNYSTKEADDLNPERLYQLPVSHRNHPKECYIPSKDNEGENCYEMCASTEVLMRKAMVHYQNARKMHGLFIEGAKAHKMLCDIDASTILADIDYLSKLIRIHLKKPSTIGENENSEARK